MIINPSDPTNVREYRNAMVKFIDSPIKVSKLDLQEYGLMSKVQE